ncbi:hypothetical protein WJX72_008161 [[Myrmecia] bisecta]|uniref:Protein kinase domain-containing protein n=1 Tax=[Myrmecia] bisecta TaxID=41462 RepID=A0AAW1Q7W5_9CHLO
MQRRAQLPCHGLTAVVNTQAAVTASTGERTLLKTGKEYAVKVIPKHREGASEQHILQKFSLEAQIMTSLGGRPEAVRLHGLYQDTTHVYMVTELCRGGDLETHLKVNGRMTEKESARVIHDVLNVLAECHRQSICYADVKPANFMLKRLYPEPRLPYDRAWPRPLPQREIEVKVVDFGCSTFVAHGTKLKRRTGTPVYMAPELFMRYYGIECDLWAMGMLLYQLLSGRLPFWGGDSSSASPFNVMVAILHQEINTSGAAWEGVSAEAKDLVHRLLDRDFNTRITAAQALKHPWIAANVEEAEERLVLSNVVKLKPRRSSLEGDRRAALPL